MLTSLMIQRKSLAQSLIELQEHLKILGNAWKTTEMGTCAKEHAEHSIAVNMDQYQIIINHPADYLLLKVALHRQPVCACCDCVVYEVVR